MLVFPTEPGFLFNHRLSYNDTNTKKTNISKEALAWSLLLPFPTLSPRDKLSSASLHHTFCLSALTHFLPLSSRRGLMGELLSHCRYARSVVSNKDWPLWIGMKHDFCFRDKGFLLLFSCKCLYFVFLKEPEFKSTFYFSKIKFPNKIQVVCW